MPTQPATVAATVTVTPAPTEIRTGRLNKELASALLIQTRFIRADIEREYKNISNRLGGDLSAAARENISLEHNMLKNDLATADRLIGWLQNEDYPISAKLPAIILSTIARPPVLVDIDLPEHSGVTLDNYGRLKKGIIYAQVIAILDSPGEMLEGESETINAYTWSNKDRDGSMNVTFKDGRLIAKSQSGLR
jgi:hypothetical protein